MAFAHLASSFVCAALASLSVTTLAARDTMAPRSMMLDSKKDPSAASDADDALLGTLVQLHTGEHVVLADAEPTQARFDALLADRATGEHQALDPRLLEMLRRLVRMHPGARVELVSGFRSEKLNEMLRKKGHHVAVHSQHSLGHAVDFRIAADDDARAVSPLEIERELRGELHWDGGVGVYLSDTDWFTHADVGPNRRWNGL